MRIRRETGMAILVCIIVGIMLSPMPSWGQTDDRIGTVIAVEGTVEAQEAKTTTWEPLQFRAAIFQNDTVRTGADSKVKVLLRDDSIMTLAERSEMQFTEFLLNPQQNQRRTVVSLALGKLRVVTTKIFGAGSGTEVRTANTVAGVRGTSFVVIFIPPDTTEVLTLDGVVSVSHVNPNIPRIEPVPPNFRTQVRGDTAPTGATVVSPAERQTIEQGLRLTEQVPAEVKTTSERQAAASSPVRGEETTSSGARASTASSPTTASSPATASGTPVLPTTLQLGAQPNQEVHVIQQAEVTVSTLPSPSVVQLDPPKILEDRITKIVTTASTPTSSSTAATASSTSTGSTTITPQPPPIRPLRLTIRIPR